VEAKIHPGVWDCSGGHVDVDETYVEAGAREVAEELGVTVEVTELSKPVFFDDTFYVVCAAKLKSETTVTLKEDEVTQVKWVTHDELLSLLKYHTESFTPWVVHLWENFESELRDAL
jgi:isopentenyldiphosphate isomerase